jgi:hypothetical protein
MAYTKEELNAAIDWVDVALVTLRAALAMREGEA